MIYTLVFRYFIIWSNWSNCHNELVFLKDTFLKNGFSISFIDKCYIDKLYQFFLKRPPVLIAEKNLNTRSFFFGELSHQTRTQLQKVLKSCCKIQIVFKNQGYLSNAFCFKYRLPYNLMSCVVCKFQYGGCNASYYGETDRNLKVKSR